MAYGVSSTSSSAPVSSTGSSTGSSIGKSQDGLTSDQKVNKVFDQYFTASQNFPSNEVDAVVGFFENRGFDKTAAVSTATTLLSQVDSSIGGKTGVNTKYGKNFPSVVNKGNIYGVQFHPEKSHKNGLKLIKNFILNS